MPLCLDTQSFLFEIFQWNQKITSGERCNFTQSQSLKTRKQKVLEGIKYGEKRRRIKNLVRNPSLLNKRSRTQENKQQKQRKDTLDTLETAVAKNQLGLLRGILWNLSKKQCEVPRNSALRDLRYLNSATSRLTYPSPFLGRIQLILPWLKAVGAAL